MIPAMSVMVGCYIFIRLCEIYSTREEKALKVLCAIGMLVTIGCVVDVVAAGGRLQRELLNLP